MSEYISQTDPKANYMAHKEEIDSAILRVLESGWYILGGEVSALEKEFAAYLGVGHAIGVGNGTDALHLAMRACGAGPGDFVITTSNTAVATAAGRHPRRSSCPPGGSPCRPTAATPAWR